jgi:hypothetical protein
MKLKILMACMIASHLYSNVGEEVDVPDEAPTVVKLEVAERVAFGYAKVEGKHGDDVAAMIEDMEEFAAGKRKAPEVADYDAPKKKKGGGKAAEAPVEPPAT